MYNVKVSMTKIDMMRYDSKSGTEAKPLFRMEQPLGSSGVMSPKKEPLVPWSCSSGIATK